MDNEKRRTARRKPIDKINVKELAKAGHMSYPQIAERLNLPLGTVQRYAHQLRRDGDVPYRAPSRSISDGR